MIVENEKTSQETSARSGIGVIVALVLAWTILSLILETWFPKPIAQGLGHFIVPLIAYPAIKTGRSPRFAFWVLYCLSFGILFFLVYKYL